jgi:hypothetical protein
VQQNFAVRSGRPRSAGIDRLIAAAARLRRTALIASDPKLRKVKVATSVREDGLDMALVSLLARMLRASAGRLGLKCCVS